MDLDPPPPYQASENRDPNMVAEPGNPQTQTQTQSQPTHLSAIINREIQAALNQNSQHTQQYVQETQKDFANKIYEIVKAQDTKHESLIQVQLNDTER